MTTGWLTITEAAKRAGVSYKTMWRRLRKLDGEDPGVLVKDPATQRWLVNPKRLVTAIDLRLPAQQLEEAHLRQQQQLTSLRIRVRRLERTVKIMGDAQRRLLMN